jgi:uncharacterized linocin/CFP29 family protein
MNRTDAAVHSALINPYGGDELKLNGRMLTDRRPYLNSRGQSVIAVNTGQLDGQGQPVYAERAINVNATLRKDEWVKVDAAVIQSARERLVIIDDMRAAGLVYNVGGLGVIISEFESQSEMTDAEVTMDGETQVDQDRLEFGIRGVPIPIIQKPFRIGERALLASRQRGAGLDLASSQEAARSVARTSEKLLFLGSGIGKTGGYDIPGLTTYSGRALDTWADWSNAGTTTATILADILGAVSLMETTHRRFGPFTLYLPGAYAARFREDFKANGDMTLMERVLATQVIKAVRFSDVLPVGNAILIQMTSDVIDLAVASDITTIQWSSPSGWTNFFQVFAAWAPRFKADFDGHQGILHATLA